MTSAAKSASPHDETATTSGNASAASFNASASTNNTKTKPVRSVNGSRTAATTGGSTALTIAIAAATKKAPPVASIAKPGSTLEATYTAAAADAQLTMRRSGCMRGGAGSHATGAP